MKTTFELTPEMLKTKTFPLVLSAGGMVLGTSAAVAGILNNQNQDVVYGIVIAALSFQNFAIHLSHYVITLRLRQVVANAIKESKNGKVPKSNDDQIPF